MQLFRPDVSLVSNQLIGVRQPSSANVTAACLLQRASLAG